jgi:drug/metabolite transporter (DMT)-like permease
MGFLVMSGTTITLALLALSQGQLGGGSFPTWRSLLFLGIGGLLNGRAMYRYSIKASGLTQTGNYVALIAVLMILEAPFFDMFLNRNWLTLRQWCGVGCGIACVYFLNQE